jgi:hypothetical protein
MACPKAKREIRLSLSMFALANFSMGMAVFMFVFCSSAPKHAEHIGLLFTDPARLFSGEHH